MKVIPLFILILTVFNCKEKNENISPWLCDVPDPANDLPWLKTKIKELESSDLTEYFMAYEVEYNGQSLITFVTCCPMCSWMPQYYDCSGNVVPITNKMALERKRDVWKPKDYACAQN